MENPEFTLTMYVPNHIAASDETRRRQTERMSRELRAERPGDYRDGRVKVAPPAPFSITKPQQNMSNQKLEIQSTRTLFMKQRWRWVVTSIANGKVTGASSEKFSRRIDMADNARLILNADLVKQLDALLEELDAK
jgi:hypothetical protein